MSRVVAEKNIFVSGARAEDFAHSKASDGTLVLSKNLLQVNSGVRLSLTAD